MPPDPVCDLCGAASLDLGPGYLCVRRQSFSPGVGTVAISSRGANLQCNCCNRCLNEARHIKQQRYWVVAFMIVWLFLSPCCIAPLPLFLGEKGSALNIALFTGALVAVLAAFLAGPLYLRAAIRRRTTLLLGPVVDPAVRTLTGIPSWGLLSEVLIVRELVPGEPLILLREVLAGEPNR
jgi:hypothetical protein